MVKLLAAKNLTGHDVTSKSDPYAKMSGKTYADGNNNSIDISLSLSVPLIHSFGPL